MFLESFFVFTKTEKLKKKKKKNSLALFWRLNHGSSKLHALVASLHVNFGDLFAGERSSREGYSEIFTTQLATPSRVDLLVTKTLREIFQVSYFYVFRGLPGN